MESLLICQILGKQIIHANISVFTIMTRFSEFNDCGSAAVTLFDFPQPIQLRAYTVQVVIKPITRKKTSNPANVEFYININRINSQIQTSTTATTIKARIHTRHEMSDPNLHQMVGVQKTVSDRTVWDLDLALVSSYF
jgi:hypothetical protein